MTFIASVLAKDGIAIVADSFVTAQEAVLEYQRLNAYLGSLKKKDKVDVKKLWPLFQIRPSYTRNYADKLFKFDEDTAVTTSGSAYINGKLVKDIVLSIATDLQKDKGTYDTYTIEQKIELFCKELLKETEEHCKTLAFGQTTFIISHYNRRTDAPQIFKLTLYDIILNGFNSTKPEEHYSINDATAWKVVTDGQDSIADRLMFGSLYRKVSDISDVVADFIFKELKTTKKRRTDILKDMDTKDIVGGIVYPDMRTVNLRELSLQEAVDFACLLMKIVMDIQVYTKRIPTVGGLVKLATISKEGGFTQISGHEIVKPKTIF